MYKIISVSKNYQGFLSYSATAILGSLMLTTTPSLGVKTPMLEDIGFTAAHKAGIDGKGQHGIVSDEKMFLNHPAFKGANIQEIYIFPNLEKESNHGTIDLGEIIAQPSVNPDSYGAAYGAKISVSAYNGSANYAIPNAFENYKEQVRAWIKTDARVINASYTPGFLIDLAKDAEGQTLLDELLIKGDRLIVNSAGNLKELHGVGNFRKMDRGKKTSGHKAVSENYTDLFINKAFQKYMDHVVYVGNLTHRTDPEDSFDEIPQEGHDLELVHMSIKNKWSTRFTDPGVLTLATKEMGFSFAALAKVIREIEEAIKAEPSPTASPQPLTVDHYVDEQFYARKGAVEEGVRAIFAQREEAPDSGFTYVSWLKSRLEELKSSLKEDDYKKYLDNFPNQDKNEKVKDVLLKQLAHAPQESWVHDYIKELSAMEGLYVFIKKSLEERVPPFHYPNNKYRLAKTSNRAGRNAQHFICTLGTDIDSTAGGFSGEEPTFKTMTGTSQAAPLVTSALLLGLQKYPGIKTTDLLKKLYDSADHLEGLEYWYGHGIMDVKRFLEIQ